MSFVKTKDGVEIYYKDWGKGQPMVFSHGWPLSADDWDNQMLFFLKQGYRVIAHDHDKRRHRNLLQGLGLGSAHRVQPRLAAVGRRLGRADAVLPQQQLPRHRARSPRSRTVHAGLAEQQSPQRIRATLRLLCGLRSFAASA